MTLPLRTLYKLLHWIISSTSSQAFILSIFVSKVEDGIRDHCVTGVQTCALPIADVDVDDEFLLLLLFLFFFLEKKVLKVNSYVPNQIGRASCRERV